MTNSVGTANPVIAAQSITATGQKRLAQQLGHLADSQDGKHHQTGQQKRGRDIPHELHTDARQAGNP
jgi:hypothetical protein